MNIVFINPEYPGSSPASHGGIATYIYTLAGALSRAGHSVHVLVRKGTYADITEPSVQAHTFEAAAPTYTQRIQENFLADIVAWELRWARGARDAVMRIHRATPVDIVEVAEYNGFAAAFRKQSPFALVVHFHTPTYLVDTLDQVIVTPRHTAFYRLEEKALLTAAAFKCTSESLKAEICTHYHIPDAKVTVIRTPVAITQTYVQEDRHACNERIDLLFAGRLERRKGAEIILNAIERILDIDPRINISFAGENTFPSGPNYRESIERKLTRENRARIWFLGPLNRYDLTNLYRRSHILLFPSLFDNASNVLIEAIASHLPIIAADVGGVNEMIRHKENGLLFKPGDIDGFLACIREFMENPDRAATMAQKAFEDIRQFYNAGTIAKQTADYYRTLLKVRER